MHGNASMAGRTSAAACTIWGHNRQQGFNTPGNCIRARRTAVKRQRLIRGSAFLRDLKIRLGQETRWVHDFFNVQADRRE